MRKYRIGFDIWGMIIFLAIMLPNFVWFGVPAPNDVLRVESVTKAVDIIASVCQVLMVIALCLFINPNRKKIHITRFIIVATFFCLLYFLCWIFYYIGVVNAAVILGLTIFPCLAFLFFAIDRKNLIAVIPIVIFTICHLIYGTVNFINLVKFQFYEVILWKKRVGIYKDSREISVKNKFFTREFIHVANIVPAQSVKTLESLQVLGKAWLLEWKNDMAKL